MKMIMPVPVIERHEDQGMAKRVHAHGAAPVFAELGTDLSSANTTNTMRWWGLVLDLAALPGTNAQCTQKIEA